MQQMESQLNLATQALAQDKSKDANLLETLRGELSDRMPQGGQAPFELRSKVQELVSFFDTMQRRHDMVTAQQDAKKTPVAQAPADGVEAVEDPTPAVGQRPHEVLPPEAAAPLTAAVAFDAGATPAPHNDDLNSMDTDRSLVRSAAAIETVASGMTRVTSAGQPEAKKAETAATAAAKQAARPRG
ncbi:unnamed protein product [Prorocentrum cordatum]|uniref:Uncharacterized protein n=1 Tax=Prorocentrum cordatum TaxID=2364126 RepID=A0ABN9VPX4_9DINO|nr:unnamed protein product [Polarella glacialis]